MSYRYDSLADVAKAFASGELDKKLYRLTMDNDCSFLQYIGPLPEGMQADTPEADSWLDSKNDETNEMFWGNGYKDIVEACRLAGIPTEWC